MKSTKILLSAFIATIFVVSCSSGTQKKSYNEGINIIPVPVSTQVNEGSFTLDSKTKFVCSDPSITPIADLFAAKMNAATGYNITTTDSGISSNTISLSVNPSLDIENIEGYTLEVTSSNVTIEGKTPQAVFYGMQSLMQLLPAEIESTVAINGTTWSVPAVSINDYPRFKYRGILIDVCRHFNNADFIKKQIDVLAIFKINRLHLHLTDDQLWAIEIKKYPRLTEVGSKRMEGDGTIHGGFLTQEDIKSIVAYANERYIDVIPEIELPGHGLAALTAYPEFSCTGGPFQLRNVWGVEEDVYCAGNDATMTFLEDVITEISPLFTSEYIHIGGDECPKDRWNKCPKCKARIKKEGLKNAEELQSYVVRRLEKHINSLGKKIIGWDEILEGGIDQTATIMSWRGEEGGIEAANAGHDVIMTPNNYLYLDYYQGDPIVEPVTIGGFVPLEKVYGYNPTPADIAQDKASHVIGVQGNVWSEYLYSSSLYEYSVYPRILAVAEVGWSPIDKKSFEDFSRRINNAYVRLDAHNINYHIALPEGPESNYIAFLDSTVVEFKNNQNYPMVYTIDGSEPTATSAKYETALSFDKDATIKIATLIPSGKISTVRTLTLKKEALSAAFEGETKPGVKVKRAEGFFLNSKAYDNANFTETIAEFFTPSSKFDYRKPCVEVYKGYFEVPQDGVYVIVTDNEQLIIDGTLVIDNDDQVKRHGRNKSTKALAKGKHSFVLKMNNSVYGGWPNNWNHNNFMIKVIGSDKFEPIVKEQVSF